MPKISIIVPVYKAERYLGDCIDSILSQTYTDFEVILVDDGSPDNCGDICEAYAGKDSRIRVLHQENQGQAAARNHALAIAEGTWICFVDSDDLIHPQLLQLLYGAVEETGAGISMCQMLEDPCLPEDFFRRREPVWETLTINEEVLTQLYDREEYPAWVACAKLIRKDLVQKHLFCEGRVFEDNEAVCHWVCAATTLARTSEQLYFYRTNQGSTTKRTFSVKKLDYLWALENLIVFYGALGYTKMKKRFADRYALELANCCNGVRYDLERPELVRQIRRQAKRIVKQEKLTFSKEQQELLLDAMHPKLVRLYWPVEGLFRTLRETGLTGLMKKLKKNLGKGESE